MGRRPEREVYVRIRWKAQCQCSAHVTAIAAAQGLRLNVSVQRVEH